MALRYCVYKDCHNYYNMADKSYSKENLTFFQFPKDPQRRLKWLQLGKAQPNLLVSYYFYCSDHFDKKFMSQRHRRTVLVGEAVPYPHESLMDTVQTKALENLDELTSEYYVLEDEADDLNTVVEEEEDNNLKVESTTVTVDNDIIQLAQEAIDTNQDVLHVNDRSLEGPKNLKRKTIISISPASSSLCSTTKVSKSISLLQLPSNNSGDVLIKDRVNNNKHWARNSPARSFDLEQVTVEDQYVDSPLDDISCNDTIEGMNVDPNTLVDIKHVTTFIFKGEEYVQMPKDYYIKEKIKLVNKIQKFEIVLENVKKELNTI